MYLESHLQQKSDECASLWREWFDIAYNINDKEKAKELRKNWCQCCDEFGDMVSEEVKTTTDAKVCGEWTEFAEECGETATPTLVVLQDGKVIAKIEGSNQMTTDFWKATINKHKNNVTRT